jgi:hypothetical protein
MAPVVMIPVYELHVIELLSAKGSSRIKERT